MNYQVLTARDCRRLSIGLPAIESHREVGDGVVADLGHGTPRPRDALPSCGQSTYYFTRFEPRQPRGLQWDYIPDRIFLMTRGEDIWRQDRAFPRSLRE